MRKFPFFRAAFLLLFSVSFLMPVQAQKNPQHSQFWVSMNSKWQVGNQWFVLGDYHARKKLSGTVPSFDLARAALMYQFPGGFSITGGAAHLWLHANTVQAGQSIVRDENRLYTQYLYSKPFKSASLTLRLRLEHRWIEKASNAKVYDYSTRARFLVSADKQVFKKKGAPRLVLADELLLQQGRAFRKDYYLDQNRIFVGVKQNISPQLSYDAGYMLVTQANAPAATTANPHPDIIINQSHVLRLFFYYNRLRPKPSTL